MHTKLHLNPVPCMSSHSRYFTAPFTGPSYIPTHIIMQPYTTGQSRSRSLCRKLPHAGSCCRYEQAPQCACPRILQSRRICRRRPLDLRAYMPGHVPLWVDNRAAKPCARPLLPHVGRGSVGRHEGTEAPQSTRFSGRHRARDQDPQRRI